MKGAFFPEDALGEIGRFGEAQLGNVGFTAFVRCLGAARKQQNGENAWYVSS